MCELLEMTSWTVVSVVSLPLILWKYVGKYHFDQERKVGLFFLFMGPRLHRFNRSLRVTIYSVSGHMQGLFAK